VVGEVAALLPPLVQLEFEGRYAAMLSHEPKNYALLGYDGSLLLRGAAFRSSRAEPFGDAFLRRSIARLLAGDVGGIRDVYVATLDSLRRREPPAYDVSSRVRLTKSPAQYRHTRRELSYEAMLASGRTSWSVGDRIRIYRTKSGSGGLIEESEDEAVAIESTNGRDYDVDHYVRLLRETFAARLARAFTPADYEALLADPDQMSLFAPPVATIRTVLIEGSYPQLRFSRAKRTTSASTFGETRGGDDVAYLAYEMDRKPISLLISSSSRIMPSGGESYQSGGLTFYFSSEQGLRIITWKDKGLTYAQVSDLDVKGAESCAICHGAEGERRKFEGLGKRM
jgi:hypothetical protein